MMQTLRRIALGVALFVALVGALHMPGLRPWLMQVSGCPFPSTDRVLTAEEAERVRLETFAVHTPADLARAQPALGFALRKDTRQTIAAWTKARGLTCTNDAHHAALRCPGVSANALPTPLTGESQGELGFGFAPNGQLVSVQYSRRSPDRALAESNVREAEQALASAGPVQRLKAQPLDALLAQQRLLVAMRDFRGEVAATHVGQAYVVTQSYQTLY